MSYSFLCLSRTIAIEIPLCITKPGLSPGFVMHYSPTGRRNRVRPLKRLLDTWDRNGSTSGLTPWQTYDDDIKSSRVWQKQQQEWKTETCMTEALFDAWLCCQVLTFTHYFTFSFWTCKQQSHIAQLLLLYELKVLLILWYWKHVSLSLIQYECRQNNYSLNFIPSHFWN